MYSIDTGQSLSRQYWICARDLVVGEVGQERERALGDAHAVVSTLGVATASGTSVDSKLKVMSFQISSALRSDGDQRGGARQNLRPSVEIVAALVARLDHRLDRDAIGRRAVGDAVRVADGAAAELQAPHPRPGSAAAGASAPAWMPPDATGMTPGIEAQSCSKYSPARDRARTLVVAQRGVVALHAVGVALELADDRAGVDVIDAGQPHPLGRCTRKLTPCVFWRV